jgi:hypothetical protein
MLTCLIYWQNWHRDVGNAAFISLVDDCGWQFRTSQPIAEVVLVSVLCVPSNGCELMPIRVPTL